MLPNANLRVLESAIDYCTCTYSGSDKFLEVMKARALAWMKERELEGFRRKPWGMEGYNGQAIDGLSVGHRDHSTIIRLSGLMAKRHAAVALTWATNVTRLDLQVTLQDDDLEREWARAINNHMQTLPGTAIGYPQVSLTTNQPKGSTVYVGARISHRFFRCYDKTAESDNVYPPGCWRFEMEYKQDVARSALRGLASQSYSAAAVMNVLQNEMMAHQMRLPAAPLAHNWRPTVIQQPTDDQKRIEWLRRSIRPMLDRMLETLPIDTITDALGLPLYPTFNEGGPIGDEDATRDVPPLIG